MNLIKIRKEIDEIDDSILELFLKRIELTQQAAEYKKYHDLPIINIKREQEIIDRISKNAGKFRGVASSLFNSIFIISRNYQKNILEGTKND